MNILFPMMVEANETVIDLIHLEKHTALWRRIQFGVQTITNKLCLQYSIYIFPLYCCDSGVVFYKLQTVLHTDIHCGVHIQCMHVYILQLAQ